MGLGLLCRAPISVAGIVRILITGGSGFIGRNLAEQLAATHEVLAPCSAELDLLKAGEVREYLAAHSCDIVVHSATTRSNRRLPSPPDLLERNCRMFFNLARNVGRFGKMIHLGSGAEYGRTHLPAQVREDYFDTCVPADPYGFSKYICAKYIACSNQIVDLRLFGVFGKYEDYAVRFISNACCRAVKGLPIVIRQDVVFDYLYINDLARIVDWFISHEPHYKAYNVCTGVGVALTQLARVIGETAGHDLEVIVKSTGLAPEYTADNSLLLSEIDGFAFAKMPDCIKELYTWYAGRERDVECASLRFDE
jgi:UDP-glucose 4-epimerase